MADVCGPWTLDQLDQFGTLDSLNFSLDDPIWSSADTCVLESSASVSATASTTSFGGFLLSGAADIAGSATIDASAGLIFAVDGSATGEATITAVGGLEQSAEADVYGFATVDATAGLTISAAGNIVSIGSAVATSNMTYVSGGNISGVALQSCTGLIYGEEWSDIPVESTVWTQKAQGSDQWQSQG